MNYHTEEERHKSAEETKKKETAAEISIKEETKAAVLEGQRKPRQSASVSSQQETESSR